MGWAVRIPARPTPGERELHELVYELLDAHADTAALAADVAEDDPRWARHLDYLRDLQRVGRERLASPAAERAVPLRGTRRR